MVGHDIAWSVSNYIFEENRIWGNSPDSKEFWDFWKLPRFPIFLKHFEGDTFLIFWNSPKLANSNFFMATDGKYPDRDGFLLSQGMKN